MIEDLQNQLGELEVALMSTEAAINKMQDKRNELQDQIMNCRKEIRAAIIDFLEDTDEPG